MKTMVALAAILSACAPAALAQEPQTGSMRLLTNTSAPPTTPAAPPAETPAAPPVAEPVAASAAPAPTAVAATGWKGTPTYSPMAAVELIGRVCRPATTGDGGDVIGMAADLGLGAPVQAREEIAYALPPGAVTWKVPSLDGELYLFGYGETPLKCGAVVARPMPEAGFNKVLDLLKGADQGFVADSAQTLPGNVSWARMRSPKHEFVDVMEYPASGDRPGVLRADYLPE